MAGNIFGDIFRISTFGESHAEAVGVILDGCPSNLLLEPKDIQKELDRRRPGTSSVTTSRKEQDKVQILSGVFEGKTTGTPIAMLVYNQDQRSKDYSEIMNKFRPGHADFTYEKKYGTRDYRGGGRASARETIGRVAAGAVAKKLLANMGVEIIGFVNQVGHIKSSSFDKDVIELNPIRSADLAAAKDMEQLIHKVKAEGDSIGAGMEFIIKNMPIGIGEPVFDRLNAKLAHALFSIPAIKAVEFGVGFEAISKRGSENNDSINAQGFDTNHSGGMLGGISNGEDIVIKCAIKPTSSISKAQKTIDKDGVEVDIQVHGRHDPCLGPRAIPICEAMIAITLMDLILIQRASQI